MKNRLSLHCREKDTPRVSFCTMILSPLSGNVSQDALNEVECTIPIKVWYNYMNSYESAELSMFMC